MITLPGELEKRLKRFRHYLIEGDVEGIKAHGYTCFSRVREEIEDLSLNFSLDKYKASRLTYKQAEPFAKKLGMDLMMFALKAIQEEAQDAKVKGPHNYDDDNMDWHVVTAASQLCELGWAIMYYDEA